MTRPVTRKLPPIVVLCGGRGTRLRDVVADRPKVLADVGGRPFLAHLLDHLAGQAANQVILSAGHLGDQLEAFVRAEAFPGLDLRVVIEPTPRGTAGAIRFAIDTAGAAGNVLALNGDTFFSGSLRLLADRHAATGRVATLAVVRVPDARRYGTVRFDESSGDVTTFEEKGTSGPGWINAGVYGLSPAALSGVAAGVVASLEHDVLPALVDRGVTAVPYPEATFLDIGTPDDYARAGNVLQPRNAS